MSYNHKIKELTDNIRKHRELLGYSQGKMAELLDVSRPFYCQVETGKRILSLKRLIQISDIFNVTLDVLTKPRTVVAPDPTDQSENQTDQSENTLNEILNTYGNRGFEANKTKKKSEEADDSILGSVALESYIHIAKDLGIPVIELEEKMKELWGPRVDLFPIDMKTKNADFAQFPSDLAGELDAFLEERREE